MEGEVEKGRKEKSGRRRGREVGRKEHRRKGKTLAEVRAGEEGASRIHVIL